MRWPSGNADAVGSADHRIDAEPFDRRPGTLQLFDAVAVDGQRKRHFARGDQVREKRMAAAHRPAGGGDDVAEKLRALLLPHALDYAAVPFTVGGFHAEPAFPLRVRELRISPRQLVLPDPGGVVRLDEYVKELRYPVPVRRHRLGQEVGVMARS